MPPTSRSRRQLGGGFRGTRRPARANRPVIADRGCAARDRPFDELAAGPEHGDLPDPATHGTPPRARTNLLLARRHERGSELSREIQGPQHLIDERTQWQWWRRSDAN